MSAKSASSQVPALRVRTFNNKPVNAEGDYILYWMTAFRRPHWNFALDHAIAWARELNRPLLVFEPLRAGYKWASDRIHRFIIQGMAANADVFAAKKITYFPYVETTPGDGSGLLEALCERACVVVGDDYPAFFLPHMVAKVGKRLPVRFDVVDSNGLLPMRAADRAFTTAYSFRRFLQKTLPEHLPQAPKGKPFSSAAGLTGAVIPAAVRKGWPQASAGLLRVEPGALAKIDIDHSVEAASVDGGIAVATKVLDRFFDDRLKHYCDDRNHPDDDAASGFSPYLHFGHLSTHEVFHRLVDREDWDPSHLPKKATGSREGWWGMSPEAESFLDEIVTWREVGYNMCAMEPHYDRYSTLPAWAKKSLAEHQDDAREHLYKLPQMEEARTDDKVWNAAQCQLLREGRIHNYMRMIWGKRVLEWTRSPEEALDVLVHLNNKYAVDGRDPNSYSGIFWTFGRYDRAWAEREIFGKVRYMSSENTLKKLRCKKYLLKYS